MAHYIRVIKLQQTGDISLQDLGDGTEAADYTNNNLPAGITLQDINDQATTTAASLSAVQDVQRQVTVVNHAAVIDTNAATARSELVSRKAAAAQTLQGIEASGVDAGVKTYLIALRQAIFADGAAEPPGN